jgi:glycosyltransferase involved in cell wall biosynthesis
LKVLILTYYWPPSGGSGVQRWYYFSQFLPNYHVEPIIITVKEDQASYKFLDSSLVNAVGKIRTERTDTLEPFGLYAKFTGKKSLKESIPQGFAGESNPSLLQKISRAIRGNLFIPDARIGWNSYAYKRVVEIIKSEKIDLIITTGPPHSTHLIGLKLKKKFGVKWLADFRDPWTEVYYNKLMYRTASADAKDKNLELKVIVNADHVLTVGPGMQKLLASKLSTDFASKFSFIYNGYDAEKFQNLSSNKDESYFLICHLGVLSDNQPVSSLIEALVNLNEKKQLPADRKLKIRLVGKVSPNIVNEFKKHASIYELDLIEYVSHTEAIQFMLNADLLLNSLAETDQSALLISGKLMEYIAAKKPVLCLGNESGDAAALLNSTGVGKVIDRKNVNVIEDFLKSIFAYEFIVPNADINQYSRKETAKQLAALINQIEK